LQSRLSEFEDQDAVIVAVSVDLPEDSATIAGAYGIEFPILSDPSLQWIDAFGVRHVGGDIEGGDIARPATFLLNRDGKVVWRHFPENWRVRVRPEELLEQLARIP
jgi:peroxiredoxin